TIASLPPRPLPPYTSLFRSLGHGKGSGAVAIKRHYHRLSPIFRKKLLHMKYQILLKRTANIFDKNAVQFRAATFPLATCMRAIAHPTRIGNNSLGDFWAHPPLGFTIQHKGNGGN